MASKRTKKGYSKNLFLEALKKYLIFQDFSLIFPLLAPSNLAVLVGLYS
jgi:hypothetical protein